jgi:hypothetical protein
LVTEAEKNDKDKKIIFNWPDSTSLTAPQLVELVEAYATQDAKSIEEIREAYATAILALLDGYKTNGILRLNLNEQAIRLQLLKIVAEKMNLDFGVRRSISTEIVAFEGAHGGEIQKILNSPRLVFPEAKAETVIVPPSEPKKDEEVAEVLPLPDTTPTPTPEPERDAEADAEETPLLREPEKVVELKPLIPEKNLPIVYGLLKKIFAQIKQERAADLQDPMAARKVFGDTDESISTALTRALTTLEGMIKNKDMDLSAREKLYSGILFPYIAQRMHTSFLTQEQTALFQDRLNAVNQIIEEYKLI